MPSTPLHHMLDAPPPMRSSGATAERRPHSLQSAVAAPERNRGARGPQVRAKRGEHATIPYSRERGDAARQRAQRVRRVRAAASRKSLHSAASARPRWLRCESRAGRADGRVLILARCVQAGRVARAPRVLVLARDAGVAGKRARCSGEKASTHNLSAVGRARCGSPVFARSGPVGVPGLRRVPGAGARRADAESGMERRASCERRCVPRTARGGSRGDARGVAREQRYRKGARARRGVQGRGPRRFDSLCRHESSARARTSRCNRLVLALLDKDRDKEAVERDKECERDLT
ncbi:hypothetical protein DFH09DRAFT_1072288 [Mycena vulgaris]|nr:hypothetical protein DFH09DRAFT_1072288 [Mycena vulgaris]